MKGRGNTLECPQAAASLAQRVHKQCCHEETNGQTDCDLDHGRSDVEHNSVETVRGCLQGFSKRCASLGGNDLRRQHHQHL